mmetsp:Transcript_6095/g.9527  ORF Transcript_6095/g.9527 Transcript_6095/m.9527 type:complete len:121 (+) Transcript_6095:204-566(+)
MFAGFKTSNNSQRSYSTRSTTTRSSISSSLSSYVTSHHKKKNKIEWDEVSITKADVKQFGNKRFRDLCRREGTDVAIQAVEQHCATSTSTTSTSSMSPLLQDMDVWAEGNAIECVIGAAF